MYSHQGTQRICWVSSVPSTIVPCIVGSNLQFPQTRNGNSWGCTVLGWSLPPRYLGSWALHSRLSRTITSELYCTGLVRKVCLLSPLLPLSRWPYYIKMSSAIWSTWQLCRRVWATFTGSHRLPLHKMWDGSFIWQLRHHWEYNSMYFIDRIALSWLRTFSPSQMSFHAPIYMSSLRLIYCIRLLKEHLKITW